MVMIKNIGGSSYSPRHAPFAEEGAHNIIDAEEGAHSIVDIVKCPHHR
jgi:hypothetical protein